MPCCVASRWSGNDNTIFPDRLEIDDVTGDITYYKGTIVGYRKSFIARSMVAGVRLRSGLIFADIYIESTGAMQICARGFIKKEAKTIYALLS